MQIDRIIYPVNALGPGDRLVIWTVGCSKHCYMCANPELWDKDPCKEIDIDTLVDSIEKYIGNRILDGITFTGGDPMEQFDELYRFLRIARNWTNDILVYTGYTLDEIKKKIGEEQFISFQGLCSVLIDGRYVDALNDDNYTLRGSKNQKIYYFDSTLQDKYIKYIAEGRRIQNISYSNSFISVGIHNRESEDNEKR